MTTMSTTKTNRIDPDSKPKLKDINKYVKPFTVDKWYDIGLELGVGESDELKDGEFLDGIKSSCGDNEEKCFMETIKTWVHSVSDSSEVTWRKLLHCLRDLRLHEAVRCVEDNLQGQVSTNEALSSEPMSVDSIEESDQMEPANESMSVDTGLAVQQDSTIKQALPIDTQLVHKDECHQETVPMVPLYIDPPDAAPNELMVTDQQECATAEIIALNPPSHLPVSLTPPEDHIRDPLNSGPVTYSLTLPPGHKIRDYQRELAEPGIRGNNYIFVAPTGSGKTLIAAMVICEHLKKMQAQDKIPRVVFSVTTKPLADQQKEKLQKTIQNARVACVVGDGIGSIKDELTRCEIVVCTTGKFVDELKRDWVSLTPAVPDSETSTITLLVMDECHHARKSSAQAKLMHQYLKLKLEDPKQKLPQVVGLTASPGAGDNPNLEHEKTIDHLIGLCALLDATSGIVTVRHHQDELENFTTKPTLSQTVQNTRSHNEEFIASIKENMAKLEDIVKLKCQYSKWSQRYETEANKKKLHLEISTNPNFRDQISTLKLLICYCQALNIYMDLRQEDALKVLEEYTDLPDLDDQCTECERGLKKDLNDLVSNLKCLPPVENQLLKTAEDNILTFFKKFPDSRGVFFVHTKRHAYAVCEWIKSLAAYHKFLKPQVITGHTRDTGHGMTQSDQEAVMEDFRSGECNILVATSVAEEGLDVPACNFVIRFQHVSNEIAKAQTQGRARAEDSEVITILSSDSAKSMKEIQNAERLELVNTIIRNDWLPRGKLLQDKLEEQQESIIQDLKWKNLFIQSRKSAQRDQVKIMCRKCKTVACYGSDVFTIKDSSHHIIPGDEIKTKLIPKPHHKPGQLSATISETHISKTHKIYCKECDADWGIMCFWLKDGFEFPVLKCKSFIFQIAIRAPFTVAQWSKAPFQALPLKAWIAGQQADDESDSDTDS